MRKAFTLSLSLIVNDVNYMQFAVSLEWIIINHIHLKIHATEMALAALNFGSEQLFYQPPTNQQLIYQQTIIRRKKVLRVQMQL